MNAFNEHHKESIRFGYRCFDRILLNGLIQPFQQPERVIGLFGSYRQVYPVSRDVLRGNSRVGSRSRPTNAVLRSSRRQKAGVTNLSSATSRPQSRIGWSSSSRPESRPAS